MATHKSLSAGRPEPLASILTICACATLSGDKSIDEHAEWGQRAPSASWKRSAIRTHPLSWRRAPSASTIDHVLMRIDTQALDTAIGVLKVAGADNIAKTTRAIRDLSDRALSFFGIVYESVLPGT